MVRIGKDKKHYTVETMDSGRSIAEKEIEYYDYFTESGVFLKNKFRKVVEKVIEDTESKISN